MAADGGATAVTLTAAGITVFGISTGLQPEVMIAGFAGGLWAQAYHPPTTIMKRIAMTILASVLSGYLTPAISASVSPMMPVTASMTPVKLPIAVLIGLLAQRVLGPWLMKFAAKKADAIIKKAEDLEK